MPAFGFAFGYTRRVGIAVMEIQFRRTGERRYAVTIFRQGQTALEMNPAPGYDARMPHDLIHLVVERALGLRRGIFGQIAAGGTAGTFHPVPSDHVRSREASRRRRELARRGARLLREGHEESAVSERAAQICHSAWLARTARRGRHARPGDEPARLDDRSDGAAAPGADLLTPQQVERICDQLDELSAEWTGLAIGEALTVTWPE
jgi:hypothetical protein